MPKVTLITCDSCGSNVTDDYLVLLQAGTSVCASWCREDWDGQDVVKYACSLDCGCKILGHLLAAIRGVKK